MAQPRRARGDIPENRLISGLDSREFPLNPFAQELPAGIYAAPSESNGP